MKLTATRTVLAACICAASAMGSEPKIERQPLQIGTVIDIGQIIEGESDVAAGYKPYDGQMLQRTSVYLNQFTTVNDRLDIKVGVGGMFFYGYPEGQKPDSRSVRFGPGIGQAQAIYKFGSLESPFATLHLGLFPYKYNPDAKNLGEYLMRSGTYPGYEVTGGWQIINSAAYMASGMSLHGNFLGGKLSADLNVFMERDLEPLYDLSPSILFTYKPVSMIEMGAGVQFAHLIPVAPRKVKSRGVKYDNSIFDTLITSIDTTGFDTTVFAAPVIVTDGRVDSASAQPFTFQGTKLMARLSANFGALFNNPFIGRDGLKFYSEIALLGLKDYPYFYEDKLQRMPILLGVNLPTFGFFDLLSVEYEFRKWGFPNSTYTLQDSFEPIPDLPDVLKDSSWQAFDSSWAYVYEPDWRIYDPSNPVYWVLRDGVYEKRNANDGNHKWTVYAKKQFIPGFTVYVQAASDYMRAIRFQDFTFSREVVTRKPNQWYYLVRLEFGI